MIDPDPIRERFAALSSQLDERARRLLAATEARAAGYGGIAAVSQATGVAPSTIGRGLKDLAEDTSLAPGRIRRPGGGRKALVDGDPTLLADLLKLASRPATELARTITPSSGGNPNDTVELLHALLE